MWLVLYTLILFCYDQNSYHSSFASKILFELKPYERTTDISIGFHWRIGCLIFIFNLMGFRLTKEPYLSMSQERFNSRRKAHCDCGHHHPHGLYSYTLGTTRESKFNIGIPYPLLHGSRCHVTANIHTFPPMVVSGLELWVKETLAWVVSDKHFATATREITNTVLHRQDHESFLTSAFKVGRVSSGRLRSDNSWKF